MSPLRRVEPVRRNWPGLWALAALSLLAGACQSPSAVSGDAALREVYNDVQIGPADGPLEAARNGDAVLAGMRLQTAENSLVQVAFSAGPVVRLSSNTALVMEAAAPEEVLLRLEAGRLRLSLFGRPFGVTTTLGLARLGGFAEVLYQTGDSPEAGDDSLIVRCYSGPCRYEGPAAAFDLDNLETLSVAEGGLSSSRAALTELDLRQFIADNPGSVGAIASLTAAPTRTPTSTPLTPTAAPTRTSLPATAAVTRLRPADTRTPTATFTRTRPPAPRITRTFTPSPTVFVPPTDTPAPSDGGVAPPPPTATNPPPPTATNPPPPTITPIPTDTPEPTITPFPTKTPEPTNTPG